jgi:hypothetical protein
MCTAQVYLRSEYNHPFDDARAEAGIHFGDCLMDALEGPGVRRERRLRKRLRDSAGASAATEGPHLDRRRARSGVPVDLPDVSKQGV